MPDFTNYGPRSAALALGYKKKTPIGYVDNIDYSGQNENGPGQTGTYLGRSNVYGVPGANNGAAAAPVAPDIVPQDKVLGSTGDGGDIAYTGGDANALQYQNTMRRKRNAAASTLLGL